VSGVLFFTRSVSLEGNRRIEKWKKIRQGENIQSTRGLNEDGLSTTLPNPHHCSSAFHCAVTYIHHFHDSAQILLLWSRVDGCEIRCLSH